MERNEPIISTNTRYPRSLHDALQKLAREHRRSFNAEVMWALQHYVSNEEATEGISKAAVFTVDSAKSVEKSE